VINAFVNKHRPHLVQALALMAVACMVLSAYLFRPQAESLVRYRPTPGPKDYYDPLAPWFFAAGALALLGSLALARRVVPSHPLAGGSLDALRPLWAWVLVVPGMVLLFIVAEINGQMVAVLDRLWPASPHVQFVLLIAGIVLLAVGLGGFPACRGRASPARFGRSKGRPYENRAGESLPKTSPPGPLSTHGGGEMSPRARVWWWRRGVSQYAPTTEGAASRNHLRLTRLEIVLVLLLTMIALGVRLYRLGDSVRTMIDEIHFAFGVTYFWKFPDVNLLEPMPTTAAFPFIFSYGEWGTVALFGRNFLGLRAFSAILGALTVPVTYGLARELFDRQTAILAGLVLLSFPPHVHYSRLALNNIADPLFGTLALFFLARALRRRHRLDYVLAGMMLGATQYFYEGGRILFPALIAAWMGIGLVLWQPRPSLRGLILLGLAALIIAMPVYYTLVGVNFPLFDRVHKAELDQDYWSRGREKNDVYARIARFKHSLLHYVNAPENTLFHFYLYYGGDHPLLLIYMVPPFLLGVVIALSRWRSPAAVLAIWLLITTVGNALLLESAVSARYVVIFPALAILVALGVRVTLALIWPEGWPGRARSALLVLIALGMAIGQGVYYFGTHIANFTAEVQQQSAHDVEDALLRSADFPPGTEIWLIGDGPMMDQADAQRAANFFGDDLTIVESAPYDVTAVELVMIPRDRDLAFFFAPTDRRTLDKLMAVFGPHVLLHTPYQDVPPDKAFVLFYVPAEVHPPQAVG
jgi:4-amino-4-deoxy-L-arabinose transferase-like glycosyltransferase